MGIQSHFSRKLLGHGVEEVRGQVLKCQTIAMKTTI